MADKVKIINPDGTKAEVELPEGAKIDFQGLGALPPDDVSELAKRKVAEGIEKAKRELGSELESIKAAKTTAEQQLEQFKANLADKDKKVIQSEERFGKLEQTIKSLTESLEAQRTQATEAIIAKEIADARAGLAFNTDEALPIFDMMLRQSRQADGTYELKSGLKGTAKQKRDEWLDTDLAKNLLKSQQRPGFGTSAPGISGKSFSDILADPALKAQYIKAHGKTAFAQRVWEEKKKSLQPKP